MTSTLSTLWFYLSPDDLIHTHTSLCILWIGFLFSYILVGPPFPSLFSFSSFFFTHLISLMIDKTNPCPIDQIKVQYMEPATISSCNRARAHSPLHEMVPPTLSLLKKTKLYLSLGTCLFQEQRCSMYYLRCCWWCIAISFVTSYTLCVPSCLYVVFRSMSNKHDNNIENELLCCPFFTLRVDCW